MAKNSVAVAVANKEEQLAKILAHLGEGAKKKDAIAAYEAVFAGLTEVVNEGKKFTTPLGKFDHALIAGGREIRDPKTGETTGQVSKASHKLKFKASSTVSVPQPR